MTDIMKLADNYARKVADFREGMALRDIRGIDEKNRAIDVAALELQSAIETLQAKLEAANQLAQLNGEIAASLKDERNALQAKLNGIIG